MYDPTGTNCWGSPNFGLSEEKKPPKGGTVPDMVEVITKCCQPTGGTPKSGKTVTSTARPGFGQTAQTNLRSNGW